MKYSNDALSGTIILYPNGIDSVLMVEGRTFVIRGRLRAGLRALAKEIAARSRTDEGGPKA